MKQPSLDSVSPVILYETECFKDFCCAQSSHDTMNENFHPMFLRDSSTSVLTLRPIWHSQPNQMTKQGCLGHSL